MKPHRGTLILVFGILGLVGCGPILGIPAWIMGNTDLKEIAAGRMDPAGQGNTKVGKILGMISCILAIIGIVVGILFSVFAAPRMAEQIKLQGEQMQQQIEQQQQEAQRLIKEGQPVPAPAR